MTYDIIVIGAGAAGMVAAIEAAKLNKKVCILEHNDRVGKKILSTGNGKCNLTNLKIDKDCYYSDSGEDFFKVIEGFTPQDIIAFFNDLGLYTKNKADYIYPLSEQAGAVLDCLRYEAERLHIDVFTNFVAETITKRKDYFEIEGTGKLCAQRIILATGSKAAPKTGSRGKGYDIAAGFGHSIVPVIPALVQIKCSDKFCAALHGVRCNAKVTLCTDNEIIGEESGELQLVDYGISGIPVFQLSRSIKRAIDSKMKPYILVDFLPEYSMEELKNLLCHILTRNKELSAIAALSGILNKRIATVILKSAGYSPATECSELSGKSTRELARTIKKFTFHPLDTKGFDNAQICAGGVSLAEINLDTMESVKVKGLYFAGEILDVDGKCGGYNLTWAFASGHLAGVSAALD